MESVILFCDREMSPVDTHGPFPTRAIATQQLEDTGYVLKGHNLWRDEHGQGPERRYAQVLDLHPMTFDHPALPFAAYAVS